MPVRYDPSIAAGLAREILARWKGMRARALHMDAGRRAAELELEDESLLALLAPAAGYVLPGARGTLEGDGVRTTRLGGALLADAWAFPDERGLVLALADEEGRPRAAVALELQTNHWNLLSLRPREGMGNEEDESVAAADPEAGSEVGAGSGPGEAMADGDLASVSWTIAHALWTRDVGGRPLRPGRPYLPPESTRRAIGHPPSLEEWRVSLEDVEPARARGTVLRTWAWTSTLNVDWLLGWTDEAGAPDRPRELGDEAPPIDLEASFERYLDIRAAADTGSDKWIVPRRGGPQPYPARLGEPEARRAESLLGALAELCQEAGGPDAVLEDSAAAESLGASDEKDRLERALERRADSLRRKRGALQRQLENAGSPDEARAIAQLLLVRKDLVKKGQAEIRLEDFDGTMRRIDLDPALDGVSNAERYFAEARRRERALTRIPQEIAETEAGLERLAEAGDRLEQDGPSDDLWKLAGQRPPGHASGKASKEPETRLPYWSLTSSGGLEIRIGRGARDNDDLTFRHSSPEDIWLHARQVSGAHVILRWDRRDQNPPQRDLVEAAVAAAVNSGARHSGTVPVVWTRRKYVRKPRKSPPGTVAPDRVRTVFVEPDEGLLDRLRRG